MSVAKEELYGLIERQPDDSTLEEIAREIISYITVKRGLADSDAGRVISDEEMGRRIKSWAK